MIFRQSFPYIFLVFILFNACAVGPDFERPETNLPSDFQRARLVSNEIEKKNDTSHAEWWANFNDPIMSELISKASSDNYSIQSAMQRIEESDAIAQGTFLGLFPKAILGTSYVKNKTAAARFPGITRNGIEYELYSLNGQTSWEIDVFGKIRRQVEGTDAFHDRTIYSLVDLVRIIQAQTGTTYLTLRGHQKKKEVIDQSISNQTEIFKLTEAKYNIGQASKVDLERSRAQLETVRAREFETQGLIDALTAKLSTLTKTPIEDIKAIVNNNISIPTYSGPLIISSPADLLIKRPDVRIAEEDAHIATTEVGVSWANFLPQVTFNGTLSRDARDPSDWSTSAAKAYNYGPSISWSILNIGTLINLLDASEANARASVLNYQAVVIQALEEVEVALSSLTTETQRAKHLENAQLALREAYRISEIQYKEGILPYSTLLVVEQDKLQAEFDALEAETRVSGNFVNLFKALGGAWEEES